MATTWILHRFRSGFFYQNLLLIVLGLLRESEKTEWEVQNELYSRYKAVPTSKEFRRLLDSLVKGGYVLANSGEARDKLSITEGGNRLLRSLESEYRWICARADEQSPQRTLTR